MLVVAAAALARRPVPAEARTTPEPACQVDTARPATAVTGTVIDPSGGTVNDAVALAICGTEAADARTGADGRFTLSLRPGRYRLEVAKAGFDPVVRELVVAPEANAPLRIALAVGAQSETVTVVSAAASERTLRDAPASISVVTAADLQAKPFRDLADAIVMTEGVTARRAGNQVPTIQVRGLDSQYTLILIDGKRVNATSSMFRGNDYDTGWVPASAVERIEVVRGPMSSLYGSDAIGGVINIITKRVGDRWNGSFTASRDTQENRAAGDAYLANLSLAGPLVRERLGLKVYAGLDHRAADGTVNPVPPSGGAAQPGLPANDNRFVATDLGWVANRRHDMTFHVDTSRRDHGGFLMKREAGSFAHKGTWDRVTTDVLVYGDEIRNLTGTVSGQINPNRATSFIGEGKAHVPFKAHVVTVGGQYRREALDDPANLAGLPGTPTYGTDPHVSIVQAAAFAEADVSLGPRLRATVGHRFDHHENFGGNHSPRIYGVFHATKAITVKGGIARAFRAPTLLQNSPTWGAPSCGSVTTGCFIVGSTDLDPETATSGEASVQFDRGAWSASVTSFRNSLRNMIDITSRTANVAQAPAFPNFIGFLPAGPPGNGRPIFKYQNVNKVRTQGIETMVRYTWNAQWRLKATYGYLDAENLSGATPIPLVYRPAHTYTVSATWTPAPPATIVGLVRGNGEQFISVPANGIGAVAREGYAIVDLTLSYRVARLFTARGGVLNVANTALARETSLDFNEDGRRYFAGVAVQF